MNSDKIPSLFLGPKGEKAEAFASLWEHLLSITMQRRASKFVDDPDWPTGCAGGRRYRPPFDLTVALESLLTLLREEIPTFSPRYPRSYGV